MTSSPPRALVWFGLLLWGGATLVFFSGRGDSADNRPAASPGGSTPAAQSSAPQPRRNVELRAFMRKKLEASAQVLEGLTTDDLELVKAGAVKLHEMSAAERWFVSADPVYRQFSGDFRQITQQLIEASEAGNADRAAIKWMDATMSCLDCHRFVRGMHIAQE